MGGVIVLQWFRHTAVGFRLADVVRKKKCPISIEWAYSRWLEYYERHDKLSKLKQTNAELQNQIADLKRELEELKGKE
jgi:cell division protein FtsB